MAGVVPAGASYPAAEGWAAECLSLPLYPELTADQVGVAAVQEG